MENYHSRKDVPLKYRWNTELLYQNEEEWHKDYEKLKHNITLFSDFKNCVSNPEKLKQFLDLSIESEEIGDDLYVYAYMLNDQELGIAQNISRLENITKLASELELATNFFNNELLELSFEEFSKLEKEPILKEYIPLLNEVYRQKKHILSEAEENLLTKMLEATNDYDKTTSNLNNREHEFGTVKIGDEKVKITSTNYRKLLRNKDSRLRKKVYTMVEKEYAKNAGTSASLLNSYVKMDETVAKIRKYDSAWDSYLFENKLSNNVFVSLKEVVFEHLDIYQKYLHLRQQVLNLSKQHKYDLYLDMTKDNTKEYSIEEAQDMVRNATFILGSEYLTKFDKIISNRAVDYCEYAGKCSGGYCISAANKFSFILMSFLGDMNSVSTLAHESGHHVHFQFLAENVAPMYQSQPSFVCEVASLLNELLLSSYISNHSSSKEEKLVGLENAMDTIQNNLYGAVREGFMEEQMHDYVRKGNTITKDYMYELSKESLHQFMSEEVILDDLSYYTWLRRSHYFSSFYLYSYAISVSIAAYLANEILKGNKEILTKYYDFLRTGNDISPMDVFLKLGINLEDKKVYEGAISYFSHLIDEYQKIYESGE